MKIFFPRPGNPDYSEREIGKRETTDTALYRRDISADDESETGRKKKRGRADGREGEHRQSKERGEYAAASYSRADVDGEGEKTRVAVAAPLSRSSKLSILPSLPSHFQRN